MMEVGLQKKIFKKQSFLPTQSHILDETLNTYM